MTILGISTNSRVLALAVVTPNTLLDYTVQLHTDRWSPHKAAKLFATVQRWVLAYKVHAVALALPLQIHLSKETKACIAKIEQMCDKHRVPYTCQDFESFKCLYGDCRAKKQALMMKLSQQYPDLARLHKKELQKRQPFYMKLFEAVAAATIAQDHY